MGSWDHEVDPQLRGLLWMVPGWDWGPWRRGIFVAMQRWLPLRPLPPGVEREVTRVGDGELRLFRPEGGLRRRGALLWMHGGGRVLGQPDQDDVTCARIAARLGMLVVSTSYRLAPEHPFPAALDDVARAWSWLVDQASDLGVDHLIIGGESAGGGLAAELAQRLRDEGGAQPKAQVLIYPMLDDRTALDETRTRQRHLVWSNTSNRYAWSAYLGEAFGAEELPPYAAAARHHDLSGLPAAWVMVGDLDLFYDEDSTYVRRLEEAGVVATLHVVPGGFHGIFAVGTDQPAIRRVWDGLERFLQSQLDG